MSLSKNILFYFLIGFFIFFLLPASVIWARMESDNYVIYGDVLSSGGNEISTSDNFGIQDTIGEGLALSSTSTSDNFGIKAGFREMYADSYVTLSLGSASLDFGSLSPTETKSGSHTMTVETDAPNGFTVTLSGNAPTRVGGLDEITQIGLTSQDSSIGSRQFGLNLVLNPTLGIGADPSGSAPIGSAASQYNEPDKFAFLNGSAVATSSTPINSTIFTVSYIANISSDTPNGSYASTLTYEATVNY